MATLTVLRGPDRGRTFENPEEPSILGRQSAQIPLSDQAVSREHAELRRENGGWVIRDLGSSNGTYLNGQRIQATVPLKHGDQIKIGGTLLVFSGEEAVERFSAAFGAAMPKAVAESATANGRVDSSILSAIPSSEDSVILAAPETADAVHAWKIMYQAAEILATFTSVDELLERITELICAHFVYDRVLVLTRVPGLDEFNPHVVRFRTDKKGRPPAVPVSRTIINHVRQSKSGLLCANAMTDERFREPDKAGSIHSLGLRSVLCVPVLAHGEVQGIIHVDCSMAHHTYTQEQLRLATAIGRMTGMAIENARLLQSRVQHERLAAVGETVAYLSHHIRNILQGLRSGADVLELGIKKKDLDAITSGWSIIQRNLERTLHLTTNMLTFSKDRRPHVQLGQLNRIVEDAVQLAQRQADEKGVMLLSDFGELPPMPLDVEGIHQVILNLTLNGIDACPATGGRVVVSTAYDPVATAATLLVSDNGPGIAEKSLGHLFEPFHSTKGQGGTGLGLPAARKIVREIHGEISVESRPGEGTTFRVTLKAGDTRIMDSDKTHGPPR